MLNNQLFMCIFLSFFSVLGFSWIVVLSDFSEKRFHSLAKQGEDTNNGHNARTHKKNGLHPSSDGLQPSEGWPPPSSDDT